MKRDPTIRKILDRRNRDVLEEYDFKLLRGKPSSSQSPPPIVRMVQTTVKPKVEPELSPLDTWMR